MKKQVVILGGPGDGAIVAEAARAAAEAGSPQSPFGFLNDRIPASECVCGLPVLGTLEEWPKLAGDILFIAALHKVGDMHARIARIRNLRIPDDRWATVRHPFSQVAQDAVIGRGVFVASFVTVQPGSRIGDFVSVRPGAHISHDTVVGDFAYVGSNATLSGRSKIGRASHIGPNAVVREGITVGDFTIVGMGAVMTKSVDADLIVAGNPARVLRPRLPGAPNG